MLRLSASMSQVWRSHLSEIMNIGDNVSPRGKLTKEILQKTIEVDMRYPVLINKDRQLNYKFMAAEAYWILTGDNRVETIKPFNSRIAEFSDDGETFFGAYGPKVMGQMDHVVLKLVTDPDSRQAGLTIWRENPPDHTRDVPCTVAIFFNIRDGFVNCSVYMRSSDGWLGVPYDVFNFSMIAHYVCAKLNEFHGLQLTYRPGTLYLTMASAHLYEVNWNDVKTCIGTPLSKGFENATPPALFNDVDYLMETLDKLRYATPGSELRWWESK